MKGHRTALLPCCLLLVSAYALAQENEGETCPTIEQSSDRTNRYCITGTGTGTGYSFALQPIDENGKEIGDPQASRQNVPGPAAGLNSTQLRDLFVEELNGALRPNSRGSASIDKNRDNCLFIHLSDVGNIKAPQFVLKVGSAGADADKLVTEEGVSYNPLIRLAPCSLEIPTLGPGALLVLLVLIALTGLSSMRSLR